MSRSAPLRRVEPYAIRSPACDQGPSAFCDRPPSLMSVVAPLATSVRKIWLNSSPPRSRVKRKYSPERRGQLAPVMRSGKNVSWRRAPPGKRTSWTWLVSAKRVSTRASRRVGCQPAKLAVRNSVYRPTEVAIVAGSSGIPSACRFAAGVMTAGAAGFVSAGAVACASASVASESDDERREYQYLSNTSPYCRNLRPDKFGSEPDNGAVIWL